MEGSSVQEDGAICALPLIFVSCAGTVLQCFVVGSNVLADLRGKP